MNKKTRMLKKVIELVLFDPKVIDAASGGGNEDEMALWTINKKDDGKLVLVYNCFLWLGEAWHHKSYWEMEGPALLNCPLRLFQYDVDPKTMFPQWRYEVKKYHEGVGEPVQHGDIAMRLIRSLEKGLL